jgi:hypothetical protein
MLADEAIHDPAVSRFEFHDADSTVDAYAGNG